MDVPSFVCSQVVDGCGSVSTKTLPVVASGKSGTTVSHSGHLPGVISPRRSRQPYRAVHSSRVRYVPWCAGGRLMHVVLLVYAYVFESGNEIAVEKCQR